MSELKEPSGLGNFESAKDAMMKLKVHDASSLPKNIEGFSLEVMFDSGHEPGSGTSRDDLIVGTLEDGGGNKQYFKIEYYFRNQEVQNVELITEDEAQRLIKEEKELSKPNWEEKK